LSRRVEESGRLEICPYGRTFLWQFDCALFNPKDGLRGPSHSGKDALECGSEKSLPGRCTMPHYVFLCRDCNKKFEQTLHISELGKAPVKCPHCGSEKTEQQAATFAAVTSKKS
jgi:putative FmdB family regulatory protein